MKIYSKALLAAVPQLAKLPKWCIGVAALAVPHAIVNRTTEFVDAPNGALLLMGFMGLASFVFTGWVVKQVLESDKRSGR